jgi:hypothetical protein
MKPRCCPYCKQPLAEIRLGVKLSPLKARIFDLIVRSGRSGITLKDIQAIAFDDRETTAKNVSMHVTQINEQLAGTDYRIAGRGFYRLQKVEAA